MSTKKFKDIFKSLPVIDSVVSLLSCGQNGDLQKASNVAISSIALCPQPCTQDLDNPTRMGIFVMDLNSQISRPTTGSGWNYGYVFNFTVGAGLQMWLNYSGYIAIRGKGAVGAAWSPWYVMQRM